MQSLLTLPCIVVLRLLVVAGEVLAVVEGAREVGGQVAGPPRVVVVALLAFKRALALLPNIPLLRIHLPAERNQLGEQADQKPAVCFIGCGVKKFTDLGHEQLVGIVWWRR